MRDDRLNNFIADALAIEVEEAKKAGALGYMARAFVQATMPHSQVPGAEYQRSNGTFKLTILSPSDIGIPWGVKPRLILAWLSTEAVRTKQRRVILGETLGDFIHKLGLNTTGGERGSYTAIRRALKQLFAATIRLHSDEDQRYRMAPPIHISDQAEIWWQPRHSDQIHLFESHVMLSKTFFDEVIAHPVPIHLEALKLLKRSPMKLDIYCWLTYRMSYLSKRTKIPWPALQLQFGAGYPDTAQGLRSFKHNFLKHLKYVQVVYPEAKVEEGNDCLVLKPSKTHIPKISS